MKTLHSTLMRLIREIPVALFFIYLGYLCIIFHNRDHMMLDYSLTFDHWWYFYHRLREGSIAQWNPYSLLGRIAVQWNYVPVSVFSPFLALSELTLKSFHNYQVISTFISLSAIYLVGRFLKYDRYYSLLPVVLIVTSGYRYWAAFLHFSTFLFFYPLAIVFLISALDSKGRKSQLQWLIFVILMSLSFTGLRLEKIVYAVSFISLTFFILGLYQYGNWRKMFGLFALGIATVTIALASNAWHLSLLINSTMDNYRLAGGPGFSKLFDPALLKWVLISIIYQPAFTLVCLNLFILRIVRLKPLVFSGNINYMAALFFIGFELILMKLILSLQSILNVNSLITTVLKKWDIYRDINIILSWYGIASILVLTLFYFLIEKKMTMGKMLSFSCVLFTGFYIAEYSWHTWPLNINRHFFFMLPIFTGLVPIGAVSLMLKKKTWIIALLAAYHFIGETGSFFLFEVIGMPWNVPRAALMEAPFQAVLILEAVAFLVQGTSLLVHKLRTEIFTKFKNKEISYIEEKITLTAQIVCVFLAFFLIKAFLMPVNAERNKYIEDFPFKESNIHASNHTINANILEAHKNAEHVKQNYEKQHDPFKRVRIEDSILSFGPEMFYKFMPAFSQTLNTAPVYSSEIPTTMKKIFSDTPGIMESGLLRYHPEMNPLFFAYKESTWDPAKGDAAKLYDYTNQVTVMPHKDNNPVFREIMAEEGSNTPRAFMADKVVKFSNNNDEYNYLNKILSEGGLLTDQITTSDGHFSGAAQKDAGGLPLKCELLFIKDGPEDIALSVDSNKAAYLALMDLWSRGWTAAIDGKQTTIYRGYIGTRFIRIEPGKHIIEFRYTVPGLIVSSTVSIMTWISLLLAAVMINKKEGR